MQRRIGCRRILHADAVGEVLADGEIVDGAGAAAVLQGRLHPIVGAAGDRGFAAGIGRPRLQRDVHHIGRPQAILCRQGARDQ